MGRLEDLDEVIVEAWLAHAPKRLVEPFLARAPSLKAGNGG
jgi:hypothetical protein